MTHDRLVDPAVVVLAGAAGSGKSTWGARRFRAAEVVSSDALRAAVGSGPSDLDASVEAFALLDQIVSARTRRSLTTVIDPLGVDPGRRTDHQRLAREAGLPAVLVIMDTAAAVCRERNRESDRPVPAPVLTDQIRKIKRLLDAAHDEGWDQILIIEQHSADAAPVDVQPTPDHDHGPSTRPRVILQVSRFPWPESDPAGWMRHLALTADEIGFDGLALMDHLIQLPQVDRAWEPIPEPWVTLGMLAGLDTNLRLGTLVSPVTFREPGIIAKTVGTVDGRSSGRAFCGRVAGWWLREHQAYGLDFPNDRQRLDQLQICIETLQALWAPGTKAYHGRYVHLPETTCYPRPGSEVPIIVGGSGGRGTRRIAAEQADGCNLPSDQKVLRSKIDILHRHCAAVGREPESVEITVLDLPVIGTDREAVALRVERLRGRLPAAVYTARHHAAPAADHARRYLELADLGIR